jgi:uncharacterized protein
MNIWLLIVAAVGLTSLLSGILGMAGGLVLMAILVALLPVASAMVIHGLVQAAANGWRALFLLPHVQWRLLGPFFAGGLIALGAFRLIGYVPDPAVVLILMGSFPWLARLVPRLRRLDVTHRGTGLLCGISVTTVQLLAGVAGPLLDLFYLNSKLNRYQIIASKAMTQTVGHLLKLSYYATLMTAIDEIPYWFWIVALLASMTGTWFGTRLVEHFTDQQFRRVTGWIILGIGTLCMLAGVYQLLN